MTPPGRSRCAYLALCAASALGYAAASLWVRSDHSRADLTLFLTLFLTLALLWAGALWLARKGPPGRKLIFASAILFRLLLLPAGFDFEAGAFQRLLLYDDDVWRYLWEGRVWSAELNPMKVAPEQLDEYEVELEHPRLHQRLYNDPLWSDLADNVGYPEYASPYPWVAQGVFRFAHALRPGSVWVFKLLIVAFDLGAVWLLAGICRRLGTGDFPLVAYAWCPLVIKEFAGSGHLDAVLVFLVVAALRYVESWGRVPLALAVLVKPTPLVLVPAFLKRLGWRGVILPVAALALIASDPPEGMKAYAAEWTFNPALARLLPLHRLAEVLFPLAAVGLVALLLYRKDDGSPQALYRQRLWLFGTFLLCTPMLAPWYLTWILPFAVIRRAWFWLALSGSIFLSYHVYLHMRENLWFVALEFAIPVAVWLWARRVARRQKVSTMCPA